MQRGSHRVQQTGSKAGLGSFLAMWQEGDALLLPSPVLGALKPRGNLQSAKDLAGEEAVLTTLWTVAGALAASGES